MNKKIKYLIKFVSKKEYADDLINGSLFMRPARYYHTIEKQGQGDFLEGALSHEIAMFKNINYPIYCTYAVFEVLNNEISFPEKIIKDFDCENGYAILIDFEKFESNLAFCNTNGYQMNGGLIQYRHINFNDLVFLINNENSINLLLKHPKFAYQQEFRLYVFNDLGPEINQIIYKMPSIAVFSKIIKITDIPENNGIRTLKI